MEEDNNFKEQKTLSANQITNYTVALKKAFLLQSSKGYWGRGKIENKVTYTSQGIQLMLGIGVDHNNKYLKKAIRWLEDNVGKVQVHWATRVEIGAKLGDFHKLATDDAINKFIQDLRYDLKNPKEEPRLDLFWDVIPTLIALHPYENEKNFSIPHKDVINRIIEISEKIEGTMTVQFQENYTGLVALYLTTIIDKDDWDLDYKKNLCDYKKQMVNWLIGNRKENANSIYWQGRGITAYVLIDLLGCELDEIILWKYIPKIIQFITPNSRGRVKKDHITTYDTKLHAEPLYVSMLILRAMTEVLNMSDESKIIDLCNKVIKHSWLESFVAKIARTFYYNKKKIQIIAPIILCIFGAILYILDLNFLSSLLITTGASALLNYFLKMLDKE